MKLSCPKTFLVSLANQQITFSIFPFFPSSFPLGDLAQCRILGSTPSKTFVPHYVTLLENYPSNIGGYFLTKKGMEKLDFLTFLFSQIFSLSKSIFSVSSLCLVKLRLSNVEQICHEDSKTLL
jgi:hypothetical protein